MAEQYLSQLIKDNIFNSKELEDYCIILKSIVRENKILFVFETIDQFNSDNLNPTNGDKIFVDDASGDPSVSNGSALYEYSDGIWNLIKTYK